MLNWGPFMLKPRTGVQTLSLSNLYPSGWFPLLLSPPQAEISHLVSLARLVLGSLGLHIFPPYNFKSEEHFSKSQGTLIYWA